jgi:hypothetical protein
MINAALTVGFGAIATAIGFRLSRRARDTEWRTDAWDQAGSLLKILGTFVVLLGFALLIQSRNLANPTVATQPQSLPGLGLRPGLPRPSAEPNPDGKTENLPDSPKPPESANSLRAVR